MNRKTLSAAISTTLPVMMGYLSIGMAFGLMLQAVGYNFIWAFFMSVTIYAGSGQYLGVQLLSAGTALAQVALLTFLINFRHVVYGLSMFDKFRGMGKRKLYMIFALTDETYALLSSASPPPGVERDTYYFLIALLDQSYWIVGSVLGGIIGSLLNFNTQGIDFAMTALFIVICIDQWRAYPAHASAVIGAGCTVISLLIFGPSNMLLPALGAIIALLLAFRNRLDNQKQREAEKWL
ncbi:MAG: AzlC family ABC transporter permease [Oscillospiraceae bacterium]|nr:AzlC family ABC transporter permease [Oscillospiraceae bacterium]